MSFNLQSTSKVIKGCEIKVNLVITLNPKSTTKINPYYNRYFMLYYKKIGTTNLVPLYAEINENNNIEWNVQTTNMEYGTYTFEVRLLNTLETLITCNSIVEKCPYLQKLDDSNLNIIQQNNANKQAFKLDQKLDKKRDDEMLSGKIQNREYLRTLLDNSKSQNIKKPIDNNIANGSIQSKGKNVNPIR